MGNGGGQGSSSTGIVSVEDRFVQVSIDKNGKVTVVDKNIDQAAAARRLVAVYLAGNLDTTDPKQQQSDADFAHKVLLVAFNQTFARKDLNFAQKLARLRRIYGNKPKIITLVAQYVGEDVAEAIWGVDIVFDSSKNEVPPDQPVPQPANVVPAPEQAQGQGPVAPQANEAKGTTPDLKGSATGTSTEGKSNGAPDGSPEGKGAADAPKEKKTGGDPVILASGCFYYQINDLSVPGCGLGFSFTRTYLHQTRYNGPMGFCWDHCYNLWLRESQEVELDGTLRNVVYRSNGMVREDAYTQIIDSPQGDLAAIGDFPDAVFEGPPGFFDRLEKVGGRYTLLTPDGTRIEYGENLYVERIVDRNDNALTFEYEDFLLRRVTDPLGKRFMLSYDALNRLVRLRDETGQREWRYDYTDNGDLLEADLVTDDGFVTGIDYRYLGPDYPVSLQHNLVAIVNPYGETTVENEYSLDPDGGVFNRVIRQRSDDGELRYEYDMVFASDDDMADDAINTPIRLARVIHANGHAIEHWFNTQGNIVRKFERVASEMGGFAVIESRYRYNADGKMVFEQRAGGEVFEYLYQREAYEALHGTADGASAIDKLAFGNVLRVTQYPRPGASETRRIVTRFTYHPHTAAGGAFGHIASQRGPFYADLTFQELPGQAVAESFHDYDARGNLLRLRPAPVLQADGTSQTLPATEYTFNARGLVTRVGNGTDSSAIEYFDDAPRAAYVKANILDPDSLRLAAHYETDLLGRVTKATDLNGAVTETTYTAFDAIASQRLPPAAPGQPSPTITHAYDKGRRLRGFEQVVFNADGSPHPDVSLVRENRYDPYGRLIEQSAGPAANPRARVVRRAYNGAGKIFRSADALGNVTRTDYDERMNVRKVTVAEGTPDEAVATYRYNRAGEVIRIVSAGGAETSFEYDPFCRLRRARSPDGDEVMREYDATGRVVREQLFGPHPNSGVRLRWRDTETRYDAAGRVIERIRRLFVPDALPTPPPQNDTLVRERFFYDALGRLARVVGPMGGALAFGYDRIGRRTYERDADGNETRMVHDDVARISTVTRIERGRDAVGQPITQVFRTQTHHDVRGLVDATTDALGNITRHVYDSRGLRVATIAPDGHVARVDYDIFGQPVASRDAIGANESRTTIEYDANGSEVAFVTPAGGRTEYRRDHLNRIAANVRNDGTTWRVTYGRDGLPAEVRDPNGVIIRHLFSPGGRKLATEVDASAFAPAPVTGYAPAPVSRSQFVHTPLGRARAANAVSACSYRVDSLGRTLEQATGNATVRFGYDDGGRLTRLIYPDGRALALDYSPAGANLAVRQTAKGAGYPGDAAAPAARALLTTTRVGTRPTSFTFAAAQARILHAPDGRMTGVDWLRLANNAPLLKERNLFNARGSLMLQQLDASTRAFTYDAAARMIAARDVANLPLADATRIAPASSETAAPRTQAEVDGLIAPLLAAASAATPQRRFEYALDANGNRIETREALLANAAPTIKNYVPDSHDRYSVAAGNAVPYDAAGNLLDDGAARFRYDALGRLAQVSVGNATASFERDALGRVARMTTPQGTRDFVFSGLRAIEWRKGSAVECQIVPLEHPNQIAHVAIGGKEFAPLFDLMDSVVGWADAAGNVVARSVYDPFGRVLAREGPWPLPLGFAGYIEDGVSEINHLFARSYHPRFGRFLQPDPLGFGDGPNVYQYAHHAPGTMTDYLGFSGTGVDNWLSKTAFAKWVAPYSVWIDKKATFAAKVAGNIVMNATVGVGIGIILGALGPVGLLGGAFLLGMGLGASYKSYEQQALMAAQSGHPGASPLLATLLTPIGGVSIYEAATGKNYFSGEALGDDALAASTADAAMGIFGLVSGGYSLGKWIGNRNFRVNPEVVSAISKPDAIVYFGEDYTAALSATEVHIKTGAPLIAMDVDGSLPRDALKQYKNVMFVGHGDQQYPSTWGLSNVEKQSMPALGGFIGKYEGSDAHFVVSAADMATGFKNAGFTGGTITLASCGTGQSWPGLRSVGAIVAAELGAAAPTRVIAPLGLVNILEAVEKLPIVQEALTDFMHALGAGWKITPPGK